jgi:MoaA/NifB/PqqE/SkfB family radical SAM enzyme
MRSKLRILIFKECHKHCEGCCNEDWDLSTLPGTDDFKNYEELLITGGEPMLKPKKVKELISDIRKQNKKGKIFLYTAMPQHKELPKILKSINGITITIHEQEDVIDFYEFVRNAGIDLIKSKSMRLNIFENCEVDKKYLEGFVVKENMVWIKDCPLPAREIFVKWEKS